MCEVSVVNKELEYRLSMKIHSDEDSCCRIYCLFKVTESPAVLSGPVRCTSPPPGLDLAMVTQKTAASPICQTNSKWSLWPHTND